MANTVGGQLDEMAQLARILDSNGSQAQQIKSAFARKHAFSPCLEKHSSHIFRPFGRSIAKLHITEPLRCNLRDVFNTAASAVEMNRIDQHAAVRSGGSGQNASRLHDVLHVSPRHRLQIGVQTEFRGLVTELAEAVGQPALVRIVASNQQVTRTQPGACLHHRHVF